MGIWIANEEFFEVKKAESPTEKEEASTTKINEKIDKIFPTKTIKTFSNDKEFNSSADHKLIWYPPMKLIIYALSCLKPHEVLIKTQV